MGLKRNQLRNSSLRKQLVYNDLLQIPIPLEILRPFSGSSMLMGLECRIRWPLNHTQKIMI